MLKFRMVRQATLEHRRKSSVNFGGQEIFARKCPNFTRWLLEKYFCRICGEHVPHPRPSSPLETACRNVWWRASLWEQLCHVRRSSGWVAANYPSTETRSVNQSAHGDHAVCAARISRTDDTKCSVNVLARHDTQTLAVCKWITRTATRICRCPGNARFISVRQVSAHAATLRCRCCWMLLLH